VVGLSCPPCGGTPCSDPACCESGYMTKDACGCCAQCASPKQGSCGGPFNINRCARGLRCLRSCGCSTESSKPCVFPFTFQGKTYTSCTTDFSDNKKPWCAVQVHENGTVVTNQWEDCSKDCLPCDEDSLFNEQGTCVEGNQAQGIVNLFKSSKVPASLDEDFSSEQKTIQRCPVVRSPADTPEFCRCTKRALQFDLVGNPKGGCLKPTSRGTFSVPEIEDGYCFLENIQDPANPSASCFDDVQWSTSDGMFYSHRACKERN